MNTLRQRKTQKLHSEETENDQDLPATKASWMSIILNRKTLLAVFAIFVIGFINFPPPSISKEAQHWRESGHFFNHNGRKIFYRDIISLNDLVDLHSVLLIIHGYPTSGYDWKDIIPSLQTRFQRIVVPDMLGLGFSDKPRNHVYSTMEQASIIEDLLGSLKISGVHILSHDYGDTVTQELVARSQNSTLKMGFEIKSICLSNGGILPSSYQPLLIQRLMITPGLNILAGRLSNWFLFKNRMSVLFGPTTQPSRAVLRDFYGIIRHKDGNLVLPLIMEYLIEREVNEDRWVSALQRTTIPLHLIYGPHDPINAPDRFLKAYIEKIPNSGVSVLHHTGHYPQVEDPEGFVRFYEEFVDGLSQKGVETEN